MEIHDASINTLELSVVTKLGNQTISGEKTFENTILQNVKFTTNVKGIPHNTVGSDNSWNKLCNISALGPGNFEIKLIGNEQYGEGNPDTNGGVGYIYGCVKNNTSGAGSGQYLTEHTINYNTLELLTDIVFVDICGNNNNISGTTWSGSMNYEVWAKLPHFVIGTLFYSSTDNLTMTYQYDISTNHPVQNENDIFVNKGVLLASFINGKLGLGINNPSEVLDVSGTIQSTNLKLKDISDNLFKTLSISAEELYINNGNTTTKIGGSGNNVNDAGQTFFELMTEQPRKFDSSDNDRKSSTITLNWSLDNLIPKKDSNLLRLAFSNQSNGGHLPPIDTIRIELSGNSVGWKPLTEITTIDTSFVIYSMQASGSDAYSNDISGILHNPPFDARIYGMNNAHEDGKAARALVYSGLEFRGSGPPAQPTIETIIIDSSTEINVISQTSAVDVSDNTSTLKITKMDVSYSAVATTRHSWTPDHSGTNSVNVNVDANTDISNQITGLIPGTKYNIQTNMTNAANKTSVYSDISLSAYTQLPSDICGTSLDLGENIDNTSIRTSTVDVGNSNYINLGVSGEFTPINSGLQTIQISKAYNLSATQQNDTSGYGTFIDGSDNLVTIIGKYNDVEKQKIIFGGWGVTLNKTGSGFFTDISDGDMYTDISNTGFRKKGSLKLMDISDTILDASENAQKIKYEYTNTLNNNSNQTLTHTIYVDDLSENPVIQFNSFDVSYTELAWCCDISSVRTFDLDISVNLSNINSQYKFLPAGGKIATCNSLTNVIGFSEKNVNIEKANIVFPGVYEDQSFNFTNLSFNSLTTTIEYDISAHNLKGGSNISDTITTGFNCDYASFDTDVNGTITDTKCPLFYEVTDTLNDTENTIQDISFTLYPTNHETSLKDHSLQYLGGKFEKTVDKWVVFAEVGDFPGLTNLANLFNSNSFPDHQFISYTDDNIIKFGNINEDAYSNSVGSSKFSGSSPWTDNAPANTSQIRGALDYDGTTYSINKPADKTFYYYYGYNVS